MSALYIVLSQILQAEKNFVKFSTKESGILVQSQTNSVYITYFQKQNKLFN